MKKSLLICLSIVSLTLTHHAQAQTQKKLQVYPIGFYNLENLYYPVCKDSLFYPNTTDSLRDREFSPEGSYAWTMDKYEKKQSNMAYALNQMGKEFGGLVMVGVSEIGNRKVLEDLVETQELKHRGLKIVHYESPDWRGVDVGFLYDPAVFTVTSSKPYPYNLKSNPGFRTRDVLLVSGLLAGEPVHVLVNHWPSRRGLKSVELREHAASIDKHIVDSLRQADPAAKVIIMGDLNDDPTDKSCRLVLGAKRRVKDVKEGDLFNTMWEFYAKGIGSLCYQGQWNLFDQIIISGNLLGKDHSTLKFMKAEVFNKDFLIQKTGRYKGYPLRTYSGGIFQNGYSDHFPTLIYLVKEVKEDVKE
jgi:hypothetical protein